MSHPALRFAEGTSAAMSLVLLGTRNLATHLSGLGSSLSANLLADPHTPKSQPISDRCHVGIIGLAQVTRVGESVRQPETRPLRTPRPTPRRPGSSLGSRLAGAVGLGGNARSNSIR